MELFINAILKSPWQAKVLFCLALALTIFAQQYDIYYEGADALYYVLSARSMLGEGSLHFFRPPGTALFYILTGVATLDTWKIMMFCYAIMSLAIPVLVYYIIALYSKPAYGLIGGAVAILSGIPFVHSKTLINTDHLFIFLNILFLLFAALLFAKRTDKHYKALLLYLITVTLFFATMVRPVAAFNFWILISICCLYQRQLSKRHVAGAVLLYILLNATWTVLDRDYGYGAFSELHRPQTIPERRFAEVYYNSDNFHFVQNMPSQAVFDASRGPATQQIASIVTWYINTRPEKWQIPSEDFPALLFADYKDNYQTLIHNILYKPNGSYFHYLLNAIKAYHGAAAPEFLIKVNKEHHQHGIIGIFNYFWQHPKCLLLGGSATTAMGARNFLAHAHYVRWRERLNRQWSLLNSPTTLATPDNGPYSEEYFKAAAFYFHAYRHTHNYDDPDKLYYDMLQAPNGIIGEASESLLYTAITNFYGPIRAEKILSSVAKEAYTKYPNSLFMFFDNILFITINKTKGDIRDPWDYALLKKWTRGYIRTRFNHTDGLSSGLTGELKPQLDEQWFAPFWILNGLFHQLQFIFLFAAIFVSANALMSKQRYLILLLWGVYMYNVLSIAVFGAFSSNRYEDVFALIPVLIACIGAHSLADRLRDAVH